MRIYVAYRTDEDPNVLGQRKTSGSMTTLKGLLRAAPDSNWSIFLYELTASVKVVCELIENPYAIVQMQPKEGPNKVYVTDQGQVRKIQ